MYSLEAYGKMLKDTIRMEAYQEAIHRAVRPGGVVLDIGTGTGIHALMAARAGARHVYAIEPADSILLAPAVARANGLGEKISFIQDLSTAVTLPEKADVLISDLHGTLPWYHHHIPTIVDARSRLLKEGATLIPQKDTVYMAAVESAELYSAYVDPWRQQPYGFVMDHIGSHLTNGYIRGRAGRESFLSGIARIAELDYHSTVDPNVSVSLRLSPTRLGTLHGFLVWFDTQVLEGVQLTSAPFEPEISYGSSFFPIAEPTVVQPEDTILLEWRGTLQGMEYVWIWNCEIRNGSGTVRAKFQQNSLARQLPSIKSLRKRAPAYRPTLNPDGEADRLILNFMADGLTLAEIARKLCAQMPDMFGSDETALERVRGISERYG
jgi:type I protein arginine methyltransferase